MTNVILQLIACNCWYFLNIGNYCIATTNKYFQGIYDLAGLNHLEYRNPKRGFHLQCAIQKLQESIEEY
jgi:hypothetical protein